MKTRRFLQTIVDAANKMGRLIDDLLSCSRMGRTALTKRRIDLTAEFQDRDSSTLTLPS